MQPSDFQKLLAQLKRDEGERRDAKGNHVAYRCDAGALTIGYGHNLDAKPVPGIGDSITEDQALRLLEADVCSVVAEIGSKLPWARRLDAPRYAVVLNMGFNMGVPKLLGFKNFLAHAKSGDFRNAAREMRDSLWFKQVKARAERLVRQMQTGDWQ